MQGFYPCCGVTLVAKDFFSKKNYTVIIESSETKLSLGMGQIVAKSSHLILFKLSVHHILGNLNEERFVDLIHAYSSFHRCKHN